MKKKAKKTNSKTKSQINTGILVLENKKVFKGIGIGYQGEATGEVCWTGSAREVMNAAVEGVCSELVECYVRGLSGSHPI